MKTYSFGWTVNEIDGHNLDEIQKTVFNKLSENDGKPLFIISNTTKGYINENLTILEGQHGGSMNNEIMYKVENELGI